MRTTKVIAFSVPPEFEVQINRHASEQHKTISEYVREAVRQYMNQSRFDFTRKEVAKKVKARGITRKEVAEMVEKLRKRS